MVVRCDVVVVVGGLEVVGGLKLHRLRPTLSAEDGHSHSGRAGCTHCNIHRVPTVTASNENKLE